jgi:hypothetical protein
LAEGVRQRLSDKGKFAVKACHGGGQREGWLGSSTETANKVSQVTGHALVPILPKVVSSKEGIVAHLAKFRKGWKNENLASFLLSRISFVAHPVTVADDVGSDFFCTLFENPKARELFPRGSFAIQIKSSKGPIKATNKIEYLEKLELPFFVGVVDQGKLTLSIYSGEYLPILFSQHGIPQVLSLSPDDGNIRYDNYCDKSGDDYVLRMPFVLALKAGEDRKSVADSGRKLLHLCSRMHQNVSSRVSCEYIFSLSESDKIVIMAGVGSAQTF